MTDRASLFAVVPAEAHALRLFRILPNGDVRTYSATTFPVDPYQGCERTVRMARVVGWLTDSQAESYGLLEAVSAEWDILADWNVPDARAFAALKKRLNIVVEHTEAAHA